MGERSFARFIYEVVDTMIRCGKYHLLFILIKSLRQGIVYGTKIRAPHATVLELVWGSGPLRKIPGKVLRVTATHAAGLGFSSLIFAIVTRLLGALRGARLRSGNSTSLTGACTSSPVWWHYTIAGFLVGYLAWGKISSKVHQQMLIYVVSRLLVAFFQLASHRRHYTATPEHYRLFSGSMWAILMTILCASPGSLQVNMRKSLEYVFLQTDRFSCFHDLIMRHSG